MEERRGALEGLVSGEGDVLDTPAAAALATRGGLLRVGGYGLGALSSLVGIAVLARYLGVEAFGRYQAVVSLVVVVGAVSDAGLATLGIREVAQRDGAARQELLGVLLGLRVALALAGGAVVACVVALGDGGGTLVAGAALAGGGLVLLVAQTTLAVPLHATLRLGTVAAIDLARAVLTTLGYVAVALAGGSVALVLGVAVPVNVVLVVLTLRAAGGVAPRIAPGAWARLLRDSLAFAAAASAGITYSYAAQLVATAVTSDREAGLFSASFRIFVVAGAVPAVFVGSSFALLARLAPTDRERFAGEVERLQRPMVLAGGLAAVALGVGARPVLDVVAGPDFAAAAPVLHLHALALGLTFLLVAPGFALLAAGRHRALLVANAAALAVAVGGGAVAGSAWGADGVALATVLSEATLAAGYARALPEVRVPWGPLGLVVLAAAPGAALALLAPGLPAVLLAGVAAGVYAAVVARAARPVERGATPPRGPA